jgi:NADH:ubiquinone oxidoreductase subunit 6 (subunit J)
VTGELVEAVLGAGLGLVAVAAGAAVFLVDSMARATYALLLSFLAVAASLVLLGSSYIGFLTVLMMTVEMAIMGVFMLMFMMNPAGLMPMSMRHNTRGSLVIAGGAFLVLAVGIFLVPWPERHGAPPQDVTYELGMALMGRHMLTMIVIGVALLATMVAGVMLTSARGRYDRYGDDLDRAVPNDPLRGGVGR